MVRVRVVHWSVMRGVMLRDNMRGVRALWCSWMLSNKLASGFVFHLDLWVRGGSFVLLGNSMLINEVRSLVMYHMRSLSMDGDHFRVLSGLDICDGYSLVSEGCLERSLMRGSVLSRSDDLVMNGSGAMVQRRGDIMRGHDMRGDVMMGHNMRVDVMMGHSMRGDDIGGTDLGSLMRSLHIRMSVAMAFVSWASSFGS